MDCAEVASSASVWQEIERGDSDVCDGFHPHRPLESLGERDIVVVPSSIVVDRRRRRRKTDRIDGTMLLAPTQRRLTELERGPAPAGEAAEGVGVGPDASGDAAATA